MAHPRFLFRLRALTTGLLLAAAPALRASQLFVGILETDSYQSVIYGASAFSRVADLPLALELVQSSLARNMLVPELAGIAASEQLRIVQTLDPSQPLSDANPANVALIPLTDDGTAARAAFAAAYSSREERAPFTVYGAPAHTNLPPLVAVATADRHLLASPSLDALTWAWDNRDRILNAPQQSLPGTFRVLVNPQRLADLLEARSRDKADMPATVSRLFRDFETLSFALTLDGQALALSLRGKPLDGSGLASLAASWRQPAPELWNGIPDTTFLASLSASRSPDLWSPYLGALRTRLLHPTARAVPDDAFTGDRLTYLAPTPEGKGLCLVQVEPLANAERVREALQRLNADEAASDVLLTPAGRRDAGGTHVESYTIRQRLPESKAGEPPAQSSLWTTLLGLFLKHAVLEAAVADSNRLVTVIGPAGSFEAVQPKGAFEEKRLTLDRGMRMQDSALDGDLVLGSSFHLANLIRHVVTLMPGVSADQLRKLPTGGDGATFGISRKPDGIVTASLRFQSTEIATLQRINRDGREVLQELFLQMLSKQMMQDTPAPQESPTRKP